MTPQWIDSLKPGDRVLEWRDKDTKGLVLRVWPSGEKSFAVRYMFIGRERRHTLGDFPTLTLSRARQLAARERGRAAGGEDPQATRRAGREEEKKRLLGATVGSAVKSWLDDKKLGPAGRWKGGLEGGSKLLARRKENDKSHANPRVGPLNGTARSFLPHVRAFAEDLGSHRLPELTTRDCERFVSAPQAPATRNRRLTALRVFFAWAERKGLVVVDPTSGLSKERETERTRTLTDDELRRLIAGFDSTRYGRAVRLLALTGLRRDEVLSSQWQWYDADQAVLTIPPDADKSGRTRGEPRRVALSKAAVALLAEQRQALFSEGVRSDYVFPSRSGAKPHADALKPIMYRLRGRRSNGLPESKDKRGKKRSAVLPDDVTIHDIRRTVADALLNRVKAAPWVVDHIILGHARPKLLRTYMPTLPLDEAREGLNRWADLLNNLVIQPKSEEQA